MKKQLLIFLFISAVYFLALPEVNSVQAQVFKLQLANPSQQISVGNSFTVNILINTAGIDSINGDVLLIFDPARLTINSASTSNFFTYFTSAPLAGVSNKYLISSWEESIAYAKKTSTDTPFASLNLTANTTGTTTISFDCTAGSEADTNINRASDSKDIVVCPLSSLTLNIAGPAPTTQPGQPTPTNVPGVPTNTPIPTDTPVPGVPIDTPVPTNTPIPTETPTPTITPTPSNTPTPTQPLPTKTPRPTVSGLPRAGTLTNTLSVMTIGTLLTLIGILAIL